MYWECCPLHVPFSAMPMGLHIVWLLAEILQKHGQNMVSQTWKNTSAEKFPEPALFWDVCPKISHFGSALCWSFPMIQVRAVTVCHWNMDTGEYILSAWIQGLRGQRKDGHSSKMLLEMGILSSLHPAPSLKWGFSPKHQPFSSFNLEQIKLLWFLNLTKFIIICKLCREKVGRHLVPMIIFKIVWFKITHCSSQHMLCAGSKP